VRIEADTVVLAAGCMQTPRHPPEERRGQQAPGSAKIWAPPRPRDHGDLTRRHRPWEGATQGYHSLHFLEEGIKLEVLWSPPAVLAARLPGPRSRLPAAPHGVRSHGALRRHHRGRTLRRRGAPSADAGSPTSASIARRTTCPHPARPGILARHLLGLGRRLDPPRPPRCPRTPRSREGRQHSAHESLRGSDTITAANHAFGTTRMAGNPRTASSTRTGAATASTTSTSPTRDLPGQPRGQPDAHVYGARRSHRRACSPGDGLTRTGQVKTFGILRRPRSVSHPPRTRGTAPRGPMSSTLPAPRQRGPSPSERA
jgi:hypothetical protein